MLEYKRAIGDMDCDISAFEKQLASKKAARSSLKRSHDMFLQGTARNTAERKALAAQLQALANREREVEAREQAAADLGQELEALKVKLTQVQAKLVERASKELNGRVAWKKHAEEVKAEALRKVKEETDAAKAKFGDAISSPPAKLAWLPDLEEAEVDLFA
jgi:chromosome segregation ATPase